MSFTPRGIVVPIVTPVDQEGRLARGSPLFDHWQYQAQPAGEGIQAGSPREAPTALGHETEI